MLPLTQSFHQAFKLIVAKYWQYILIFSRSFCSDLTIELLSDVLGIAEHKKNCRWFQTSLQHRQKLTCGLKDKGKIFNMHLFLLPSPPNSLLEWSSNSRKSKPKRSLVYWVHRWQSFYHLLSQLGGSVGFSAFRGDVMQRCRQFNCYTLSSSLRQ